MPPALMPARTPKDTRFLSGLILTLCLALPAFTPPAHAETPPCTEMLASGNPEYPPLLWRTGDEGKQLTGAVPALLQELFTPLGVTVSSPYMGSWARVQRLARTGEIDIVAGAFVAPERFQHMDYVQPPMIHLPSAVWVPKGKTLLFQHWQDLKGLTGSTLIGNSFGEAFDLFAKEQLTIEHVRSINQSFRMARAGRVDYVLYELLQGHAKLAREGWEDDFEALPTPVSKEDLFLTLSKQSRCNTFEFRTRVAARLRELVDSGRVMELVQEYTNHYVHEQQAVSPGS